MKQIEIWTDGACSGNPGKGGWGALLRYGDTEKEICGGDSDTTNNRMEMTAAIKALEFIKSPTIITLWTDSTYVQKGITEWIIGWQKRGWKNAKGQAVKNKDLWLALLEAQGDHQLTWKWVKGHAGHVENERADALARQGMETL